MITKQKAGKTSTKNTGALAGALVVFFGLATAAAGSMPLTETAGVLPENTVDVALKEEIFTHGDGYRRETVGVGLGVSHNISASIQVQYLHDGYDFRGGDEVGDTFFRLWFFLGNWLQDTLHGGILCHFRFPTGSNAYAEARWRNLALGNNELKIGPIFQYDAGPAVLHFNAFYVFRERNGEGFYDRLYVNPLDGDTYVKVLGLNPFAKNTFLSPSLLKNDYFIFSTGLNTGSLYPFIPFAEIYYSHRICPTDRRDTFAVEGIGVNPLLMSAGCRFFIPVGCMWGPMLSSVSCDRTGTCVK
jgi:hypothetical protein